MLDSKVIAEKMAKHFPRWMDIRKRLNQSKGGQLLISIAEESENINQAIEDYKKDFFLGCYDNEDSIPSSVYRAYIGSIDSVNFSIIDPIYTVVESINDFYNTPNTYYIEDNYLYIKVSDVSKDPIKKILYKINDFQTEVVLEYYSVWNVFDEFAAFVGIKRHDRESNSKLKERILNVFRFPTGDSDSGIKNAIANELIGLVDKDFVDIVNDIKIEKPTPENLLKYYYDFDNIIEELAQVNRDIFRTKRWDIDVWQYDFKTIDYIPHMWDAAINVYTDGIGNSKDLNTVILQPENKTDATLYLYRRSESKYNEYIRNNNTTKKINFKLKNYTSNLKPLTVNYRIDAAEYVDISDLGIRILTKEEYKNVVTNIKDLVNDKFFLKDVVESDGKYTAISDDAYLSITLNNFEFVSNVFLMGTNVGGLIEENNNTFKFAINKGAVVEKVAISGIKISNDQTIWFYDLFQNRRVLANKLCEEIIIEGEQNTYEKRRLDSSLFSMQVGGLYSVEILNNRYSATCTFMLDENTPHVGPSYDGYFKYIKFSPIDDTIYSANYKSDLYTNEINIGIVNNFFPVITDITKRMLMKVTQFDNIDLIKVSLNTVDLTFTNINSTEVKIKRDTLNMQSSKGYNYNLFEFDKEINLNNLSLSLYTDIFDPLTNKQIKWSECTIETPKDISIQYVPTPYVMSSYVFNEGYIKLDHTNIREILYIGTVPYTENLTSNISSTQYKLIQDAGIIILNDANLKGKEVFVKYMYNNPKFIELSQDSRYDAIQYSTDAYSKVDTILLSGDENTTINLMKYSSYTEIKDKGKIVIKCSSPSFDAFIENDILKFKKVLNEKKVGIVSGYCYFNGDEYYVSTDNNTLEVANNSSVTFENIDDFSNKLYLHRKTNNFVNNSIMQCSNLGVTTVSDFSVVKGISKLNALTACNSFNHWNSVGCNLKLVKGKNDLGLQFIQSSDDGYAYIEITDYLSENNSLSLMASEGVSVYIGKEILIDDISLNSSNLIEIDKEAKTDKYNEDMKVCSFSRDKNLRYFLIIKGSGIIDDIIFTEGLNTYKTEHHTKVIDNLGFNIKEQVTVRYARRFYLSDTFGNSFDDTELDKDGYLRLSTNIDWNITKIKSYSNPKDWSELQIKNISVKNEMLCNDSNNLGVIETLPIQINNLKTVKNIIVKINDIAFDSMSGFTTTILTSANLYDNYFELYKSTNNVIKFFDKNLKNYFKLNITVPLNKVINNIEIYIEYKSDSENAPIYNIVSNGTFESAILDMQYQDDYKLKNISINNFDALKDVVIEIGAAKESFEDDVWYYQQITPTNKDLSFDNYRFFKLRVKLLSQLATVKINYLDFEVTK